MIMNNPIFWSIIGLSLTIAAVCAIIAVCNQDDKGKFVVNLFLSGIFQTLCYAMIITKL